MWRLNRCTVNPLHFAPPRLTKYGTSCLAAAGGVRLERGRSQWNWSARNVYILRIQATAGLGGGFFGKSGGIPQVGTAAAR
jgi:hypothetical protein